MLFLCSVLRVLFFFFFNSSFIGPTPPASRRALPVVEETDMKQVSDILARKSSKKRPGPVPPRRTTSVKEQGEHSELDLELKSRIKLQKAKVENSTVLEEDERGSPVKLDGSPKINREDSMGKSSADNLKAAQIDRSKYLISEANARSFEHGMSERASGRRLGPPGGIGKLAEGADSSTPSGVGQYPKKAIPLPQRPGMGPYKKMSEPNRPAELMHSLSVDDDSDQVRGLWIFFFLSLQFPFKLKGSYGFYACLIFLNILCCLRSLLHRLVGVICNDCEPYFQHAWKTGTPETRGRCRKQSACEMILHSKDFQG